MNSKAREAMRFIEAFLSLLLDKRVPVNWGSHAGMSCEGSITLPTPVTGDDAEVALLTRLAMHEAGHVEETEQGYSDRLTAEELGVFNVLEDPRMEAARCDKYPGASILLSRGLGEMLRTLRDKVLSNEGSTVDAWRIDLLLRSFLAVAPHAPIREHAGDILNGLAPHISDVQRQAIDGALPIVATLKSSREAESLATSIVKQLREPEPPPLPPPQGDNGGDESEDQGAREPSASDGGEPGDQQQSNPDQEPEAGNDQGNEDADPDSGMGAEQKDAEAQGSEQGGAQEPPSDAEESSDSHEGNDGAQGQGSPAESDPQSSRPAPTEADAAHQESTAPDQSRSSSGTTSGTESNEAPQGFEQESGVQTIDLGTLLREALVERYGVAQESEALLPLPVDDRDVKRLAAVLAAADPTETAEQLLDQALVALQRTEDAETSEAGPSAGMSLAPQTTGGLAIDTRLQGIQAKLATVLQRELQERRRRPRRLAFSGESIAAARYWRLEQLGDTRVFIKRKPVTGIDCAATIVIDSSISTKPFLHVSLEVAVAFSLALQRLGVRTKVVRFPGVETVTETLQRFGEPARVCVKRIADVSAGGGTPMGAAAAMELPLLLEQRKLKHVMAFITDGQARDHELLRATLQSAADADVLVVGVGIGYDVSAYIPQSVRIQTVAELPAALERLFRESIGAVLAR